ncbi:NAD(P)-binding protein [Choiromyces venosus 120613-1]|uniref:NAD(P)-binding protein n=1 Tax=Choiromyces venosus 120613-1 TaxID=1336337 RepID=A0A3N4K9T6_9PEZI|nr:NAD(P)-binding protein [Choiromyces venosus 120613-1]
MADTRKTVLITGAGVGGIGGSLAKEFHLKGYRVFATARDLTTVQELADKYSIETLHLDVTSTDSVQAAAKEISQRTGGKLDVLVNNAGLGVVTPATDLLIDTVVKSMFEVNVFGVMRMVQEFSGQLIAAEGTILTRVSKIVTGGIKTNIARHGTTLRQGSIYMPILDFFHKRVKDSQDGAMDRDVYARSVVAQVMKPDWRKPAWFWKGNKASIVWFIRTFLWSTAFDFRMMRVFGLFKLKRIVAAEKSKKD